MRRRAALAAVLCSLSAGCGGGVPPEPPLEVPPFTVRGRWPAPRRIRYALDAQPGPLGPAALRAAVEHALRVYERACDVRFVPAPVPDAELTLGWRLGRHDDCPSFGVDGSRAHTGGSGPPSFVHFDAEREWPDEDALAAAAVHELGHVLGLGHSPDPGATLHAGRVALGLGAADLAGLHTLYGGGSEGPGDLVVEGEGAAGAPVLRRVAPPDRGAWCVFDADGDGDDELLVWRTDASGAGALTVYHFSTGARVERTSGPFFGATAPGATSAAVIAPDGSRVFVARFAPGRDAVRRFDDLGRPTVPVLDLDTRVWSAERFEPRTSGDLDGDGREERITPLRSHLRGGLPPPPQ